MECSWQSGEHLEAQYKHLGVEVDIPSDIAICKSQWMCNSSAVYWYLFESTVAKYSGCWMILNLVCSYNLRAMYATWHSLLLLLLNFTEQATAQDVCPPWFIPDDTSSTGCSCFSSAPEVKCGKRFSLMHFGIIMYDLQQCNWNDRIWMLSIHCTLQYYFWRSLLVYTAAW